MKALLLIDHGSRARAANETLEQLVPLLDAATFDRIAIAHMELAEPSIEQAIARLLQEGMRELVVMPYFLSNGRHAEEDVPRLVRKCLEQQNIRVRFAQPLGVHPLMAQLVMARVHEALDEEA